MGFRRLAATPHYGGCGRRAALGRPHKQQHFSKDLSAEKPAGARDDDSDENNDDAGGDDDDNDNTNNNNLY